MREAKDYEAVRAGYNELNFTLSEAGAIPPFYSDVASDLIRLGVAKDAAIVDSGCGAGTMSVVLGKQSFTNVTAFDISDQNIQSVSRYVKRAFRASCEDIGEIGSSTIDLVLCLNMIEHVMEIDVSLREIHRILKPGGVLYLTTDNAWWHDFIQIKNFLVPSSMRYHRFLQPIDGDFTPTEMKSILSRAGFSLEIFRGLGGVPTCDRWISKLWGKPTAEHPFWKNFTSRMKIVAKRKP
ncbi:MAG: class I SAM-dependent methyltransferase [Bdellovibrionota bacterium]